MISKSKKYGKVIISVILCVTIITGCVVPCFAAVAENGAESYSRLYNYEELAEKYLTYDEETTNEYPNGAFMFPLSSAELKMDDTYALEVFRQGGTDGEAAITVKSVDMTAKYKTDYEIFVGGTDDSDKINGEAKPYYDIGGYSFIAKHTKQQVETASNDSENTQEIRDDASDYNDQILGGVMPTSSEFTLNFANGENSKTIYIKTHRPQDVTANLDFTLNLCNVEGGSLGVQTSCAFTIKEEREKPQTYLTLCGADVNPKSEEAYAVVKRSGNMGTSGSFTIRTESATAKAENDYESLQLPLKFLPGMSEIKVPITMLSGAESGKHFNVCLEDIKSAEGGDQTAQINITDSVLREQAHETAADEMFQSSASSMVTTAQRGAQIIDASKFSPSTVTDRGTGSQEHNYKQDGSNMLLEYDNNWGSRENCFSVRSNEKIDFTGIDSITMPINIMSGSTDGDDSLFYVADNDKFTSSSDDFGFRHDLAGVGGSWGMSAISKDLILREAPLDQSKVKGEHYLYLALHKGVHVGYAGYKIYNNGTSDINNSLHLNMTKYNISIVEPDKVGFYDGGTLKEEVIARDPLLGDPASKKENDRNTGTSFDIYRDETATIISNYDSKFNGLAKLEGVYFCESGNLSNHSELYKLNTDSLTLTSDILNKYQNFIKDKKIVVKPVYSVGNSSLSVESFDNQAIGQKFVPDNNSCTGEFYYDDQHIGTLSWTKSSRAGGAYYVSDSLDFNFKYADDSIARLWNLSFSIRTADTKALLSSADTKIYNPDGLSGEIQLTDNFVSVTPQFSLKNTTTTLEVKNPNDGEFSGSKGKYASTNDDGSVTVRGYTSDDGASDTKFDDISAGGILTFHAVPKDGFRAMWVYTDSASHQKKTYYGNSFFFAVQNPYFYDDNHVTLSFVKDSDSQKELSFYGKATIQDGSVINPPRSDSGYNNVASGAQLTIEDYSAMTDQSGEFVLETAPGSETSEIAKLSLSSDEIHRALVFYNNQYYICDINMADYIKDGADSVKADIKMDYKTLGASPTSIVATASDGTTYGNTITLVSAMGVSFDLSINTKGQKPDKPVNLVRWSVENDEGIKSTADVELAANTSVSHWGGAISEMIKQGDKLCVELLWRTYNSNSDAIYESYGKFNTGYNFVASAYEDAVTYAPDLGAPLNMVMPTPVLGPLSPTVSIKGFTPIINVSADTKDSEGHTLNTVTIGMSYGQVKNYAAKDPSWNKIGFSDKCKLLQDVLNKCDEAKNSKTGLPKNAIGKDLTTALNMKTAVKLSIAVTVCFQGSFYVDDNGDWLFEKNILILGAGGKFRVSMPFVLLYIPCFAYFSANVNVNVYMGIFGIPDENGKTTALPLNKLDDLKETEFDGVAEVNISLGVGVGVGYDGLLSASGEVDTNFKMEFSNFSRGLGTVGMSGSISLEILFLKASWSQKFFTATMFNTESEDPLKQIKSQFQTDILRNTTLRDMSVSVAQGKNDSLMLSAAGSSEEKVAEGMDTLASPEIMSIGGGKYLVVTTSTDSSDMNNVLNYYIYDENEDRFTESDAVLKKAVVDSYGTETAEYLDSLTKDFSKIDSQAYLTDCGDDILISWNKCMIDREGSDNSELLSSVGIATIFYNKQSGQFHDYRIIKDDNKKSIYISPKAAYNSLTGVTQLFYQSMDADGITLDTSIEEIQSMPTTLCTTTLNNDTKKWTDYKPVITNSKYIKYFDVTSYDDSIMISYTGSDAEGFTLDSTEGFEQDGDFDSSKFDTANSMYIQQFRQEGSNIAASNPIRITGDGFVTANPKFAKIKRGQIENTLLFYKCNGCYGYQNISNILSNGLYSDSDGQLQISSSYVEPQMITDTDDYTVNDDFTVYSNSNGDIYALWTTSESGGQQIWAKQFVFDRIDKVEEIGTLDENGLIVCDSNGDPITKKLDTPLYFLKGYWGGKTYLTEGGVAGTDMGHYKDKFASCVRDDGTLITVFGAYDKEFTDSGCENINNMLVVGEYDTDSSYQLPESVDPIQLSNEYPTGGETITATCQAENIGVKSGRNVDITLYVNGSAYETKTESIWLSDDNKSIDFSYTMPKNVNPRDVSMYFTVSENGTEKLRSSSVSFKQGPKLSLVLSTLSPQKLINDESDSASFAVSAIVKNIGNESYNGGDYVRLTECDVQEMCRSVKDDYTDNKPIYTSFGKEEIGEIGIGSSAEVNFISQDIPASVFEKSASATAYLECIISDGSEADWNTRCANDEMSMISSFYPGLTKEPVPQKAKSIAINDVVLEVNKSEKLDKTVLPASSLAYGEISYTSSDESVASVDEFGVVTAHKEGSAEITAEINGLQAEATATVKPAGSDNPQPENPTAPQNPTDGSAKNPSDNGGSSGQGVPGSGFVNTGAMFSSLLIILVLAAAFVTILLFRKREQTRN